jgi:hypothetical protein
MPPAVGKDRFAHQVRLPQVFYINLASANSFQQLRFYEAEVHVPNVNVSMLSAMMPNEMWAFTDAGMSV